MHDHLSDPIRPKELRTGILRHTAGFSHVLARGTWVYVDFIDMKVFGPYLPSGSSAVRAISKTLGERGIPLTSNQIQHLGPLGPVTQATGQAMAWRVVRCQHCEAKTATADLRYSLLYRYPELQLACTGI